MPTSTPSIKPDPGEMRAAAGTHRTLKQDEAFPQDLFDAVMASDNLARAWKRVKANKGAPGIDGVSIEAFPVHAREHWPALREQIEQGRYRPQAVRRVEIPKPGGGLRMLGIPTVTDRVVQQAIAQVLHADLRSDVLGFELRLSTRPQCTPGDQAGAGVCDARLPDRGGHRPCKVLRHGQSRRVDEPARANHRRAPGAGADRALPARRCVGRWAHRGERSGHAARRAAVAIAGQYRAAPTRQRVGAAGPPLCAVRGRLGDSGQESACRRAGHAQRHALPEDDPPSHGQPCQKQGGADERMQLPGLHDGCQEDTLDRQGTGELQATHQGADQQELGGQHLEDLPGYANTVIGDLLSEVHHLDERVKQYDAHIKAMTKDCTAAQQLMQLMGIGQTTATAIVAMVGNGSEFSSGRQFSAWIGLVPGQYSSGGKARLGRITKAGDAYLRSLLVLGARAVLNAAATKTDSLSRWAIKLSERRGYWKAVVASLDPKTAAKNARMAWAVLTKGESFKLPA